MDSTSPPTEDVRDAIDNFDPPVVTVEDIRIILGIHESVAAETLDYLEHEEHVLDSRDIDGTRVWWERSLVE